MREKTELAPDEELYLHIWAPAIVEYIEWVLESAKFSGKKRLYFLARDALPMFLAARAICMARGLDIECRYIKVSRYALRVPEYHLLGTGCVERICVGGIRVTLRKVLKRAGLEPEEIEAVAEDLGKADQLDRELLYPEVMALKSTLKNNRLFLNAVFNKSKAALPLAMGYLKQEGLLDDVSYGIVDSGWVGTMQQTMETLLRTQKPQLRLEGYYFGLYEIPRSASKNGTRYHAFYFTPRRHMGRKTAFSNCLFETICSSPDGMTLGYEKTERGYAAIESSRPNPNAEKLERYSALLEDFVSNYCRAKTEGAPRPVCPALLKEHMGRPEKWEVEAFGNNLFCDDVLEGTMQEVAAHLSEEEIRDQYFLSKAAIMLGIRKKELHESAWIEGSIVRNAGRVKHKLRQVRLYKNFVYLKKLGKSI